MIHVSAVISSNFDKKEDLTVKNWCLWTRKRYVRSNDIFYSQARSQKFAMGGCFGGLEAEPPVAGGTGVWGAEPPALENFAFFCKNNLTLELF